MIIDQCSIDSLLERTIKHMLFMQSINKHADKLNKSADTKVIALVKHTSLAVVDKQHYLPFNLFYPLLLTDYNFCFCEDCMISFPESNFCTKH